MSQKAYQMRGKPVQGAQARPAAAPAPANPPAQPAPAIPASQAPQPSNGMAKTAPAAPARRDASHGEPDVAHSQTVGCDGPVLLQDGALHEVLEAFVHQKIPQRAVHAKGFGAFGYFQPYQSMREYTCLKFLQDPGRRTPTATRFSLAVSSQGTPDTSRNVRGFSTKFYTQEGVFDLLCNHIPVFLVRDAIRFPEAIRALSPSPVNNLMDPGRFWDFVARAPEATHFITWLYSDVGTVRCLRKLHGYSVNTYVWKNAEGVRRYVKYQWVPAAGEEYLDSREAARLAGENPDIAGQDLYDAIAAGNPVEYELRVQMMDPADAEGLPFDPLDDTKVWNEADFPAMPVGRLVLNQNPQDYFSQVEKIAFSPANLLEGAELSNDRMLQGRSTIYWDAQRYRLGADFRSLPINAQANWNPGHLVTNGDGIYTSGKQTRAPLERQDDFAQAGERYRAMTPEEQERLAENIAADLSFAPPETQGTVLGYFRQAEPAFGDQVESKLKK